MTAALPAIEITPENRDDVIRAASEFQGLTDEMIRRAVLVESRFDILATEVLEIELEEVHLELLAYMLEQDESLHLAFRGCGKTTSAVGPYVVGRILQDPELCVLIASRTGTYAQTIMRQVKGHLVNDKLVRIFGEQKDPTKWEATESNVLGKTKNTKEATLTALGAEGSLTGRHFDIIIVDDLCDLENTRTRAQRKRIHDFYYTTLDNCLKPGGQRKVIGTRYHPHDLYGWLSSNDLKGAVQIVPALHEHEDEDGEIRYESSAPRRFTVEYLLKKRAKTPALIWLMQMQCIAARFQGKVFKPEYFEGEDFYFTELPEGQLYQVVDPAVTEKTENDYFAHMTGVVDSDGDVWVDSYHNLRIEFPKQAPFCIDEFDERDPVRLGIESNAYQAALGQEILDRRPDLKGRIIGVQTDKDKVTRALKLTSYFEAGRIHMRHEHRELVQQLLEFPDGEHDDLFDALDLLVRIGTRMRVKKKRRREPGVI